MLHWVSLTNEMPEDSRLVGIYTVAINNNWVKKNDHCFHIQ